MPDLNECPTETSTFYSGLNGGQGKGTAILWYANKTDNSATTQDSSNKQFLTATEIKPDNRLTFMFSEIEARSVLISGGKGASLALLSSIQPSVNDVSQEFVVPQGFIVSVSAFNLQVARNVNVANLIKGVKDVAYGIVDGNLQDCCDRSVHRVIDK